MPRGESPPKTRLSGRGRVLAGLGIGAGVALLLFLARRTGLVESLEARLVDVRTRHYAEDRAADPRIVLSVVEDGDIARLTEGGFEWPWSLDVNASIVRTMASAGVDTLVVDVLQLDRGAGPDDRAKPFTTAVAIQAKQLEAANAEEYAAALTGLGRTVVAFELSNEPRWQIAGREKAALERLAPPSLVAPADAPRRTGADLPVLALAGAPTWLGFANTPADGDGIVRRVPTLARWGDRTVMSLSFAGAGLAAGAPPPGAIAEGPRMGVLDLKVRTNSDGRFYPSFRAGHLGRGRAYRRVTPSQIFSWSQDTKEGKVPDAARAALAGTIVVWGVNPAGLKDVVPTPMAESFDGPEFQAAAIDDLLNGTGRVDAAPGVNLAILAGLALLVAIAGTVPKPKWIGHAAAGVALAALVPFALARFRAGVVVDLFTPLLGVLLAWGGALAARLLTEGRYNRWLEGTFSRYLAPAVIETLKEDPNLLALGGRRREVTLLFSDVAGFTKFSARLAPEDMVGLLNRYLTAHTGAVLETLGVVDKFMGDGVMAFFGDPVPHPDHAVRACRAALGVQAALPALRPHWERLGLPEFVVRVGIESGDAVVGNMGSDQRLDYTCMGDVVNLASRLEGANKAFHTLILLGPGATARAGSAVLAKPLAKLVVVGREAAEAVAVAELLAMRDAAPADLVAHADAFEGARVALMAGDLDGADRRLAEAERLRPGDGPVEWLRGVAAKMRAGTEPTPWSGNLKMEGK